MKWLNDRSPLYNGTMSVAAYFQQHRDAWIREHYAQWLVPSTGATLDVAASRDAVPADALPCYCLAGAIEERYTNAGDSGDCLWSNYWKQFDKVRAVIAANPVWRSRLKEVSADGYFRITEFNDHPDTTIDDIIEVAKLAGV